MGGLFVYKTGINPAEKPVHVAGFLILCYNVGISINNNIRKAISRGKHT